MRFTPFAALLSAALLAPAGVAQNMLANPSFESGLSGWSSFGNASAEVSNPPSIVPRTGNQVSKMYGNFWGSFNVTGIFQQFPASPGQTFTLDCWSWQWDGDPMLGVGAPNDNWVVMKIAFFDGGGTAIGGAEQTILDGNFPQNTWIDNSPVSGTAPAGTANVQALILFLQPGVAGGSGCFDDVSFTGPGSQPTYPGTGEDLVLSSAIGGNTLSFGAGNDVKTVPAGGGLIELNVSSPGNLFNAKPYSMLAQLFGTGAPPVPPAALPELWFNVTAPIIILVNGSAVTPIGPAVIGPNGGTSSFYNVPGGFAGSSLMVQAIVLDPALAGNGFYVASDAHELQFQ